MKNYAFEDVSDFSLKQNDVLILRKKVIERLNYIASKFCEIALIKFEFDIDDGDNCKDSNIYGIFITTDQILDIDFYNEEPDELLDFNLNLKNIYNINYRFKDKFGIEMDIQHCIPRRWLWEDFEEELKNGFNLIKNEYIEKLIEEKSEFDLILLKLNLSQEELDKLGISEKSKIISDRIEHYYR